MKIQISEIERDDSIQPRAMIDENTVRNYADRMAEGDVFPPVDVFFDGNIYRLANGYHRVDAAEIAGFTEIDCSVHNGAIRDAQWFAFGANAKNAQQMSNADKYRVVKKILQDDEWNNISQRKIAGHVGVSPEYVSRVKKEIVDSGETIDRSIVSVTTKNGTTYTQNTKNIGRRPRDAEPEEEVEWELVLDDKEYEDSPEEKFKTLETEERSTKSFESVKVENPEIPNTEEPEDDDFTLMETSIEMATRDIKEYIDIILEEVVREHDRHAVINDVLKYLRQKSIEYNRASVN